VAEEKWIASSQELLAMAKNARFTPLVKKPQPRYNR
jgi:hypothetical protein